MYSPAGNAMSFWENGLSPIDPLDIILSVVVGIYRVPTHISSLGTSLYSR